jgi:hypothetical protein
VKLGTRLKRPLHTDSLAVANRLKWVVVAELRSEIELAREGSPRDPIATEALQFASQLASVHNLETAEQLEDGIGERVSELLGDPVGVVEGEVGRPEPVYDPSRSAQAERFASIARGDTVPLAHFHEDYLRHANTKRRTKADDRRALRYLETWCGRNGVPQTLQGITRRRAVAFTDGLAGVAGGNSPVTLNKYVYRLSRYWQWLLKREHVAANVWTGLKLEVREPPPSERERAFTDSEVQRLLSGPASLAMSDLMRIAALSGARLDAIVDLKVGNCADGVFVFKPQKKEREPRPVPIHPDLVEIVERRTTGKAPADDLFPEWPPPRQAGSQRERSFKASNAFTAYRRAAGVDDTVPGRRRALTNFHSFRRWFITKAEQAEQAEHIIAVVVGHARKGMTLGRYSRGPLLEQCRRCVEAVRLP